MTDHSTHRSFAALALLLSLLLAPPAPAVAAGGAADPRRPMPEETVVLRPSAPPSALERARFDRWHRAWREETADFRRAFAATVRAAAGSDRQLQPYCAPFAEAVLGIDRGRVLPVPDPAADLHLRRALRAATLAAVSCLRGRPYAARGRLRAAGADFGRVEHLLRRYRRPGPAGERGEAGVVIAPSPGGKSGDRPKGDP